MNESHQCMTKAASLIGLALTLLAPESAHAIQCRITVTPVNFGIYIPATPAHLDVIGQLDVRCQAQPGSFSVSLGPGISGDQLARTLSAGGSNILNYNLYRDAARSQVWGDGTPPTFVVSGIRSGGGRPTNYSYPIYGRIFANQGPNPGIYSDDVLATVLF